MRGNGYIEVKRISWEVCVGWCGMWMESEWSIYGVY